MNNTSSPIWRRKRACTSAGSNEPTRLPRCLTPLMYGMALVIRILVMTHPFARGRAEPENQEPFRGGGRARVSEHASRESDARQPLRPDLSRSGRGIRDVKRV